MKGQGQLVLRYEALFSGVARLRTESGLSAAVYTQLTDVFLQQLVVYLILVVMRDPFRAGWQQVDDRVILVRGTDCAD